MTPLKANTFISFILLFVLLLLSGEAASQRRRRGVVPPERLQTDSVRRDSLQVDTLAVTEKKKQPLDAPVTYEANDSIVFAQGGYAHLYGQGKVNYQQIELAADVITMNMDSSTVLLMEWKIL